MEKQNDLSDNKLISYLLISTIIILGSKFWDNGIGVSSATYAAFASNILKFGDWFTFKMGKDIFDPFIDHPPLAIWIDALIFKIVGESSQSIRILSNISSLAVMFSVFKISRKYFDQKTACLSVFSLLLINKYMNYSNSGWLDMPMVAFCWLGFYFYFCHSHRVKFVGAGTFFSLAILTKGVAALAVIPISIYMLFSKYKIKNKIYYFIGILLPIFVFTLAYYFKAHKVFWIEYLSSQFGIQKHMSKDQQNNYFWYLKEIIQHGHFISILAMVSIYKLKLIIPKKITYLAMATICIHAIIYGTSVRQYGQYVLPIYPWVALIAAIYWAQIWTKLNPRIFVKCILGFSVNFFMVTALLPVKLHSSSGNYVVGFKKLLIDDNREEVWFIGDHGEQWTWEFMSTYIVWYLKKEPVLVTLSNYKDDLENNRANYIMIFNELYFDKINFEKYPNVEICAHNEEFKLIMPKGTCLSSKNVYIPKYNFD